MNNIYSYFLCQLVVLFCRPDQRMYQPPYEEGVYEVSTLSSLYFNL